MSGQLQDFSDKNLAVWYFVYFIAILLPQILLISAKGSLFDSAYKAVVLAIFSFAYIYVLESRKVFLFRSQELGIVAVYLATSLAGILCVGEISLSAIILSLTTTLMYLYFFSVIKFIYLEKKGIDKVSTFYVIFILYACVFNVLYYGGRPLLALFSGEGGYYASFFDNKNTYGLFLLLGVIFAVLNRSHTTRKKLNLFAILFIFFNLLTCGSRTSLYCAVLFIALYYLLANRKNWISWLLIILVIFVFFIAVDNIEWLNQYLNNYIFRDDDSFVNRSEMAAATFKHMSGFAWLVGYGEDAATYLSPYTKNSYFHNSFVAVIATGGIIKTILYVLLFVKIVQVYWRIYRVYSVKIGAVFIAAFITYVAYSWGESVVLLNADTQSMGMTLLLLTLPQLYLNTFRHEQESEE